MIGLFVRATPGSAITRQSYANGVGRKLVLGHIFNDHVHLFINMTHTISWDWGASSTIVKNVLHRYNFGRHTSMSL